MTTQSIIASSPPVSSVESAVLLSADRLLRARPTFAHRLLWGWRVGVSIVISALMEGLKPFAAFLDHLISISKDQKRRYDSIVRFLGENTEFWKVTGSCRWTTRVRKLCQKLSTDSEKIIATNPVFRITHGIMKHL